MIDPTIQEAEKRGLGEYGLPVDDGRRRKKAMAALIFVFMPLLPVVRDFPLGLIRSFKSRLLWPYKTLALIYSIENRMQNTPHLRLQCSTVQTRIAWSVLSHLVASHLFQRLQVLEQVDLSQYIYVCTPEEWCDFQCSCTSLLRTSKPAALSHGYVFMRTFSLVPRILCFQTLPSIR